jgi:hypothetical protein
MIKLEHITVSMYNTGSAWFPNLSGVSIKHIPTGITVNVGTERGQHANKVKALEQLEVLVQEFKGSIMKTDAELLKEALNLIESLADWIDAVPMDTVLPAMPGVDGDWAAGVVAELRERLK